MFPLMEALGQNPSHRSTNYERYDQKIEKSAFVGKPDKNNLGTVRVNKKKNYAIFKFPSFWYSTGKQYKSFLAESVAKVNKSGVQHLVIDLRNNLGGQPQILLMGHLCKHGESVIKFACNDTRQPVYRKHFKKQEKFYRRYKRIIRLTRKIRSMGGRAFDVTLKTGDNLEKVNTKLIVLINGASFSASANLASNLQSKCNAVIIGEETGGSSEQGNTGQLRLTLPHSKFQVGVNPIYFNNQVQERHPAKVGVQPDIKVIEEFGQKRKDDPYMKAVEQHINKK